MYCTAPRQSPITWGAAAAALLVGAFGCGGPLEEPASRSADTQRMPLSLAGKPLVETSRGPAIADELVVSLAPGAAGSAEELAREVGAEVAWHASFADVYVLRFPTAAEADAGSEALSADSRVEAVNPHVIARGSGHEADSLRGLQWNLPAVGKDASGAPNAGEGVRLAILDSGVAYEDREEQENAYALAPSLDGVEIVAPFDFVDMEEHANDELGHGTHIASSIAAQRNIAPIAGGVEIMPVRVLDDTGLGTELALAEGIVYAVDQGADVINMSLSFPPAYFPSRYLQRALDYASERGVVMVAAAGNHGADIAVYPAAFREVIAAGASSLARGQRGRGGPRLEPAPYSNQGFLVDVLAPGGRIDQDLDRNGYPDGILAESFAEDASQIEPILFAGTSQAAAHVAGIAASVLAENPDLAPYEVRAIIGETADGNLRSLDPRTARGHARADRAQAAASEPQPERARYFAGAHVTIEEPAHPRWGASALRFARAEVEVVDQEGHPVRGALVHGSFTGSAFGSHSALTNRDGMAVFRSRRLRGEGQVVAFQVEAVVDWRRRHVDRPLGLLRTDTCSVERLAEFAEDIDSNGLGTSPQGLGTSPMAAPAPPATRHSIESLSLLNFSWNMATVPIAVAADAAWFQEHYENADAHTLPSEGSGLGTSPMTVEGRASEADPDACVDLLVSTYAVGSQGLGTSPQGLGTSPQGLGTSPMLVPIAPDPEGSCEGECGSYREVMGELWLRAEEGSEPAPWDPELGISKRAYEHLRDMVDAYAEFSSRGLSSPVAGYANVLSAAGLSVSPRSDDEAEGAGARPMRR